MKSYYAGSQMLFFQPGDIRVKTLDSIKEKYLAYRLRKEIYCNQLQWVPDNQEEIEVDDYDSHSILLGALDGNEDVIGTVRIIPAQHSMMIEKEFISLIAPSHRIKKKANTVEISRMCICQSMRARKRLNTSHALYQSIHRWSNLHQIRFLYMVVEQKMLRNLNLTGYPCQRIGPALTLRGGVETAAALLDWHDYDRNAQTAPPTLPVTQSIISSRT